MKLNEIFVQGKREYVVTGFDGAGRPVATSDPAKVAAAKKAAEKAKREEAAEAATENAKKKADKA